jgi:hypothetical protein
VARCGRYADGAFPEDYELWLRWLAAGVRMEKLPDALLVWRDTPRRLSRTDPRYAPDAFDELRAHHLARWLAETNPHHPDVTIWGAGRVSRRRAARLRAQGVRVTGWIDIDPRKIARCASGPRAMLRRLVRRQSRCARSHRRRSAPPGLSARHRLRARSVTGGPV